MFTFAPPFASIVGRKLKNIHEQDLRTTGMIACFGLFAEVERNPDLRTDQGTVPPRLTGTGRFSDAG